MAKRGVKIAIAAFAFALILSAAGCALLSHGVAYGEETLSFTAYAADATHWSLYLGEQEVASYEGRFFDYTSHDAASVVFYDEIKRQLASIDADPMAYSLQFKFDEFVAVKSGGDSIDYNEIRSSDLSLSATVELFFSQADSASSQCYLQYRPVDGEDYLRQGGASRTGGAIYFGEAVAAGNYMVRYAVAEKFEFDGRQYEAERHSNEYEIEVKKVLAPKPDVQFIEFPYGTATRDIGNFALVHGGRFALSAEQNAGFDDSALISVEDGDKTLNFDYYPTNQNYLPLTGGNKIALTVRATPRDIIVRIGDAFSRMGEPQADLGDVPVTADGLVGDDTIDDLSLRLYVDDFDQNAAGQYLILAEITNPNYSAICASYEGWPIQGGRYMLYLYRFDVAAYDGREFTVYCDEFSDVVVKIVEWDMQGAQIALDGVKSFEKVAAYQIIFEDGAGFRRYPSREFSIEWKDDVAEYYAVADAGEQSSVLTLVAANGINRLTLQPACDALAFFDEVIPPPPPEKIWRWYNILLLVLDVLAAIAVAVLAVVYSRRRRRLWR